MKKWIRLICIVILSAILFVSAVGPGWLAEAVQVSAEMSGTAEFEELSYEAKLGERFSVKVLFPAAGFLGYQFETDDPEAIVIGTSSKTMLEQADGSRMVCITANIYAAKAGQYGLTATATTFTDSIVVQTSVDISEVPQVAFAKQSYGVYAGDTQTISIEYEFTVPIDEARVSSSEPDAVEFSDVSVLSMNTPNTPENTWVYAVSVVAKTLEAVDCTVSFSITADGETYVYSVPLYIKEHVSCGQLGYIGDLLTESTSYAVIDGKRYSIDDDCRIGSALALMIGEMDRTVLYSASGNTLTKICTAEEAVYPYITLKQGSESFLFQNGAWNTEQMEISAVVGWKRKQDCPFAASSMNGANLSFTLEEIGLSLNSDCANFGTEEGWFGSEMHQTTQPNVKIGYGQSTEVQFSLNLKRGYVPDQVNESFEIHGEVLASWSEEPVTCEPLRITLGNLDLMQSRTAESRENTEDTRKAKELEQELEALIGKSKVGLDANLSYFFTEDQLREIRAALSLYISQIIGADKLEDTGLFDRLSAKAQEKLVETVMDRLGINVNAGVFLQNRSGALDIIGTGKDGNKITVSFEISVGTFQMGTNDSFGATGDIRYEIDSKGVLPEGAADDGIGILTYADFEAFADSILDYVETIYDDIWGEDANRVISMFVSEPWDQLMGGDYTGKAYYLATEGAKHYAKKYRVQCPVDVYIYDAEGVPCGKIEDGVVTSGSENVILAVNGDEKIIILAGADYSMELVGTGKGTMKYIVEEYANGELLRTVSISNVPLTEESRYSAMAPATPRVYAGAYTLTAVDGTAYTPKADSYGDNNWPWYPVNFGDTIRESPWLTYTWYSDETLVISGSGSMADYDTGGPEYVVWHDGYCRSLIVEEGVLSVGNWAFGSQDVDTSDFRYMQMAEIADSVKRIGKHAFRNAQGLKAIYLGKSLETIDDWAFAYCNSLETILLSPDNPYFNVSENILFSEDGAKLWMFPRVGYTEYSIPDTVVALASNAFGDNQTLKKLTIPANVKELGESAFDSSPALEEITLLGDFTTVGEHLFGTQEPVFHWYPNSDRETTGNVKRLNIGSDVTSIPWAFLNSGADMEAFWVDARNEVYSSDDSGVLYNKDKTVLVKVPSGYEGALTIPESVETIENDAFDGCDQLTEIRLTADVTCDAESWFTTKSSVRGIVIGPKVTQLPVDIADQRVLEYIQVDEGNAVYSSDTYGVLYDKAKNTVICVPNLLKDSYRFPDTVCTIAENAFDDCMNLTEFRVPGTVRKIEREAFKNCESLVRLILEEGVESIGAYAVYECEALAYVSIPASVKEISELRWSSELLTTAGPIGSGCAIEFGWKDRIPDGAFYRSALTEVNLPDTIKEIGSRAFYWCWNLTQVQLPQELEIIGERAFGNCNRLQKISIPDSVHTIEEYAFAYCASLKEVELPQSLTSISNELFYECSILETVILPDGVEHIGRYAFSDCTALREIRLPAELVSVSEGAFADCTSLEKLQFHENFRYFYGQSTFSGCENLTEIRFTGDAPQFNDYTFSNLTLTAYYPEGNDTWTADVLQNYNGTVTWVPYTPPLAVIDQPQDALAERNEAAAFSVRATRQDAAFQWYYSENGVDWKEYNGADGRTDSITVTLTKENEGWYFRCRLTCGDGSWIDSKSARLLYAGQGSFGQGLYWYYEPDSQTLTISGSGTMEEPNTYGELITVRPWYSRRSSILYIVIEDGVQNIADVAFYDCRNVLQIMVAGSVLRIGSDVFDRTDDLKKVIFLGDPPQFEEDAFIGEQFRAYYPVGNSLWTEDILKGYGGNIEWFEGDGDTSNCPHANTRIINKVFAGCGYDGYTGDTYCDDCLKIIDQGEVIPGTPHDYTNWMLEYPATVEDEGLEYRFCLNCLEMDFRVIPRLETPFQDVDTEAFYFDALKWAVENGITTGTSDTTFSPNAQCMRAQVVTFLWRAAGSPEPTKTDNPFVDVRPIDFYYKAVLWAVENGITSGMDATHFGPTAYCNRAQVVTFLYRTMGSPEIKAIENPFTDVAAGSFYESAVLWAVENGITNGLSATSFGPDTICNRAQIVTFLYRAFGE